VESAVTKVNAYFGETGEEAEKSASVIEKVYANGVGESMDSVANAIIMVKKNLGDLSEIDLTNITEQAITLDELYGIDMNETLRGVNALMQQYGMTAQQAMDLIVVGTQNGLDKTNELGDNLAEYTGKFSQAGYSASEYFQLLDNGLKNGAYNLDKVNDAINEVTTRLADGTIGESIGSYSTRTQELFASWQNGGATQKQVIDSIVADIGACTSQQDALNMAALAFGTMAEDGNLKFITSLTTVGNTYDSVSGSAQGMFEATTTPMQQMEANTRKLQQSLVPLGEKIMELANTLLPPLTAILSKLGEWFGKLPEPIQNLTIILGALMVVFIALVPVIAALAVSIGALQISIWPIIAIIAAVAAAITAIIVIVKNWGAITEWFKNLWTNICNGIGTAIESLKSWFMGLWTHIQNVWNGICNAVQTAFMLIGAIIKAAFDIITLPYRFIWENCKDIVFAAWDGIKSFISSAFEFISGIFTTVWTAISTFFGGIWDAISTKVSTVMNGIKEVVSSIFTAISSFVSSVWNGIKNAISSVVDGIKTKVSSVFEGVKSTVSAAFNGIKNTASSVWNGIKNAILTPIEAARDKIKGIVDKIKGFFAGMKISLPKIKLPHFKVTGKLSIAPPSVPKLTIDWYKDGGIMTRPTLFGMNGTSLMAGGEAGAEAILPLKGFYNQLENILTNRLDMSGMEQYLAVIAANSSKGIYLEDGTLVGHLLPAIDSQLGQAQKMSRRLSL
jgi:phage-related minor tail protein